jgi:hypothetical protein
LKGALIQASCPPPWARRRRVRQGLMRKARLSGDQDASYSSRAVTGYFAGCFSSRPCAFARMISRSSKWSLLRHELAVLRRRSRHPLRDDVDRPESSSIQPARSWCAVRHCGGHGPRLIRSAIVLALTSKSLAAHVRSRGSSRTAPSASHPSGTIATNHARTAFPAVLTQCAQQVFKCRAVQ